MIEIDHYGFLGKFVYLMHMRFSGFVKIGVTKEKPLKRLSVRWPRTKNAIAARKRSPGSCWNLQRLSPRQP